MKKNLLTFAVAAAIMVPGLAFAADSSNNNTGPVLYGYAQITGAQQFGVSNAPANTGNTPFGTDNGSGLVFGANRIRLGVKGEAVPGVTYNFMAAFDGGGTGKIRIAEINWAPVPFAQLEVGKFKAPEGFEYNTVGGNELTFINRNMGESLLPRIDAGAMLHASDVMGTGIGYAVGMFDNSGGSNMFGQQTLFSGGNTYGGGQGFSGPFPTNGSGSYIWSGRLSYTFNPLLKAEISGSLGRADSPAVLTNSQIASWNVGVRGGLMGLSYAAGYTRTNGGVPYDDILDAANDLTGNGTINASEWHASLAANLYKMTLTPSWLDIEPAVRYDQFNVADVNGTADNTGHLSNVTVGLNYYVNPNNPHAAEMQINYIIPSAGGSMDQAYGPSYRGYVPYRGYAYNTLLLQFQAGF
ncbi:porin [Acidithiobacillus caldus]